MNRLTAPENDYRELVDRPVAEPSMTACVVIPVYNRVDLLARAVAGLVGQTYPRHLLSVVVADDGSEEDVAAALEPFREHLDLSIVRQEHEGYGAGQARNLGAHSTQAEVLIFIDADCLPDPDLVSRHLEWHHRADNLVVVGSRHDLDTSQLAAEELAGEGIDLRSRAFGRPDLPAEELVPPDMRKVLYRRTTRLRRGDEAFRSLVSSNFSVRRDRFWEVGGFDEAFRRWGGEDTELGWRLFAKGMFFVPADQAVVYHQIQQDAGPEGWRWESKDLNAGMIATKVPHRFYRRYRRFQIHEVPKVSWVIVPTVGRRAAELWEQLLDQHYTDWEALFLDDGEAVALLAEQNAADPRFVLVPRAADEEAQLREALDTARGEYLAILHGWAAPESRLLSRAVRTLERKPRTSLLTTGYQVFGFGLHTRPEDAGSLDQRWGVMGLPVFALARRREWSKALQRADSIPDAWRLVQELSRAEHRAEALLALPAEAPSGQLPDQVPAPRSERGQLVADLQQARSIRQTLPVLARFALSRAPTPTLPRKRGREKTPTPGLSRKQGGDTGEGERPRVRYIGWVGHENLGDEALLEATRRLMPWADIDPKGETGELLLLGGGTLINRSRYLARLREHDSPRIERAVLGTGVANPDYWGALKEDPAEWADFLSTCCYVGVRGPTSASLLRSWGYRGPLEVVGDPALALRPPEGVERHPDRVAINVVRTEGERWGGDDRAVQATFAQLVKELVAEGREVWMFSCFPGDDHPGLEIMREAGVPDLPYLAGYRSLEESLRFLASCRLLVGERLHALVLAAACGSPFVGVEYRPKVRDFARSVGQEHLVVRSDQASGEGLRALVTRLEDDYRESAEELAAEVTRYRTSLRAAAATIREALSA